jgi:hypothetical protein
LIEDSLILATFGAAFFFFDNIRTTMYRKKNMCFGMEVGREESSMIIFFLPRTFLVQFF